MGRIWVKTKAWSLNWPIMTEDEGNDGGGDVMQGDSQWR